MLEKVNLADKLARFDEVFSSRIVGYYNDEKLQVAKTKGEFVWHSHPDTDDLFLVLAGRITVETREGPIEVGEGELLVVPRGVEHRPVAEEEAHVLLIERRGTPNTGDADAAPAPEVEI
ncbi:MAG TPA: cupin domain-containing protein [Gaiellaceae bacterium]|nr:cupin domain-containing protein [Gaiellaceae bacterium]